MTTTSRPDAQTPPMPQKRITLAEFVAMGEGPPYYEFEDGLLVPRNGEDNPMSSPKDRHQLLLALLFVFLRQFIVQNKLGHVSMDLDVFLPNGDLYIPDITFITAGGSAILDPADDKIHGAPELVVEILSNNVRRDRVHKRNVYQRNGVRWYWIIEPNTLTLEEFHFMPDGTTLSTVKDTGEDFQPSIFPGLTLNLAALMGELPAAMDTPDAQP